MSTSVAPASRQPLFVIINSIFVVALLGVGAVAAWPIYESVSFVVLVVVSVLVAALIALLSLFRGWSWFTATLLGISAYLLLGVPIGIPEALASPTTLLSSWPQFIAATVFGWKQLVTVSIPVGTYQALLVPAFALFFFTALLAFSLSSRAKSLYVIAVPLLLLPTLFGLAFGSDVVRSGPTLLWFDIETREFLIGLCALVLALGFLGWRARQARYRALQLGAAAVIRQLPGSRWGAVRRGALAMVMMLVAVAVAGAFVPRIDNNDRRVLRSVVAPDINLNDYVSPLTQYRGYFDGDTYDSELFDVTGDAAAIARLRLAVLSYYDGAVYRVVDPRAADGSRSATFARIPSRLHPSGEGAAQSAEIVVGGYAGVWVPTVGALTSVEFAGDRADDLADGFYYNQPTSAGVQLALLGDGDRYTVNGVPGDEVSLDSLDKPTAPEGLVDEQLIPENLIAWVRSQALSTDAAALADLVERLRARGYLSHALVEPSGPDTRWMADLGAGYTFEPSLSGHSIDRIDAMFAALIIKQNDTTSRDDADLVAAIGDDEQFAVATALLAQYLGFPSRVVLGFTLDPAKADGAVACNQGSCRGSDLAAWVEVQGADGRWATVDVTPQHANAVAPLNDQQQDPHNLTDVVPETATEQQPPQANPAGGDQTEQTPNDVQLDLAWLADGLTVLGVALLGALAVLAPFLTILIAKARRRRDRARAPGIEGRIVGGWDEYIDAALDHGKPMPSSETRTEVATMYGTPRALQLAAIADEVVFDAGEPDERTAEAFWAIVEAERRSLSAGMSRWQRVRSAVSLRSFTQYVSLESARSKR